MKIIKDFKQKGRIFLCAVLILIFSFSCCGCLDSGYLSSDTVFEAESSVVSDTISECTHSFTPADCIEPAVCDICGETSGKALGHSWLDATCTQPQKCELCEATQGEAKGHSFDPATCTSPERCSVCSAENSPAKGHSYSGGRCSSCNAKDLDYVVQDMVWIPTKGGTKYHRYADCSNMDDPNQVTKEEAEHLGFTPCKKCC